MLVLKEATGELPAPLRSHTSIRLATRRYGCGLLAAAWRNTAGIKYVVRADIPIAEGDAGDSAVLTRRKMGSLICRSENAFATKQQAVEENEKKRCCFTLVAAAIDYAPTNSTNLYISRSIVAL